MKAIQIAFDEQLLAEFDASEEVRREGRSAVLRKATAEYLARRRRSEIAEAYVRAYGEEPGQGEGFSGWADEGVWPAK
jgi:metal-responsive CopG/Arc/MetJ family transcriptional regulator